MTQRYAEMMRGEGAFSCPDSIADIPYQAATSYVPVATTLEWSFMSQRRPPCSRRGGPYVGRMYPSTTREAAQKRRELAPATEEVFQAFSQKVFAEGALSIRMKQLIAVAVAHVTQCPYCIKGHTKAALRHGASPEELMEAIWVAAEMRAGGAHAHSILAIQEMDTAAHAKIT